MTIPFRALMTACLLTASTASLAAFIEVGDAGPLPATSQLVPGGTTTITGLAGGNDVDMFRFGWGGGQLVIGTSGALADSMLYLFNSAGLGVAGNDDVAGFYAGLTFADLSAGEYYLALTNCCIQPQSAGGAIFPLVFGGGQKSPTGPGGGQPVTSWPGASSTPGQTGYSITFRQPTASVPEPGTIALLGLGLAGLAASRRRKQ